MDGQDAAQQVANRADIVAGTQEQRAGADRRRFAHTKDAVGDLVGGQHALDDAVGDPIGIHVVELDHGRTGQQQGQDHLGGFLRGRRIAHLGIAARTGKGADQFAQVGLAATKHRGANMEGRCQWKRHPNHRREDGGQRGGLVGRGDEMELDQQFLQHAPTPDEPPRW